jgi:hypothetical protein
VITLPRWAERLISVMIPAHRDRAIALQADLQRLGGVAALPVTALGSGRRPGHEVEPDGPCAPRPGQ